MTTEPIRKLNLHNLCLGLDVGSTTAKLVLAQGGDILHSAYCRHLSQVRPVLLQMLEQLPPEAERRPVALAVTGSAGLGLAEALDIPFVQEVFATAGLVRALEPETAAVIELGGEDAKIIFFSGGAEERMNGACAGGTGAFIDQMATLLNVDVDGLDALSQGAERLYPIASRCGVFAKSDVQPLLNQGARKEDVALSIYQAVVNQTVAGLAQGRRISGRVLFLGGPLYYCRGLRQRFQATLGLSAEEALFPPYARLAVALGAAIYADRQPFRLSLSQLRQGLSRQTRQETALALLPPLFRSQDEYAEFQQRHSRAAAPRGELAAYSGPAWLGIDCGSTTTKLVLLSQDRRLLHSFYAGNAGHPLQVVKEQLLRLYELCGRRVTIAGAAVTGYGEDLIKQAFCLDCGLVETVAHFRAAQFFQPRVDFILDIGGQDIKCFRIKNRAIDSMMLNEACSSGCGSFIETFAKALGCDIADFARLGLFAERPVSLGSRCTVFMNSAVKQAQKDGLSLADISAGLAVSVVKNALYKVIRVGDPSELGQHIVVQGGTLLNDAVLRAFERELGREVVRPDVAGLMGAFGAALYAQEHSRRGPLAQTELARFSHQAKAARCQGCANNCRLTVNSFDGGRRYISGNRCPKGGGQERERAELPNLYAYKRERLLRPEPVPSLGDAPRRGRLGLPLALGMYELLPLWRALFTSLGFEVVVSPMSDRALYEKGQFTIPSDTACYPAKLMHGHMLQLLEQKPDAIFYPCLSYNIDEHESDNHYNCPIVAYYAELLRGNLDELRQTRFLYPYLNINKEKELAKGLLACLRPHWPELSLRQVRTAVSCGFAAYQDYMADVRREGEAALAWARRQGVPALLLAGRPYHIDAEIGHGLDQLAASLGCVVLSEDAVAHLAPDPPPLQVLNQWTYHARLYRAAALAAACPDIHLVQLVSFGCGMDAITTDEVRAIVEARGRYYTQLKIDEITNLGAVRIRLRSLLAAVGGEQGEDDK